MRIGRGSSRWRAQTARPRSQATRSSGSSRSCANAEATISPSTSTGRWFGASSGECISTASTAWRSTHVILEESDDEIDALCHDWLIGVSSFFRDPEAFQALESALPELLAGREDGSLLRIWVPGCATGEEAYSLVIVLLESLRRLEKHLEVQVFATDLNPAAIQVARAGRYPEGIAADVSDTRLARFFVREDEFYRVKKELRDLVVFAVQDALHDPPFTRVDLVSCRNLLIYLEPSAQRRLLRSFHYSLNPRGILLLGSSENAAGSEEFFSPLDGHCKIFRRNDATAPQPTLRWPADTRREPRRRGWRPPRSGQRPIWRVR